MVRFPLSTFASAFAALMATVSLGCGSEDAPTSSSPQGVGTCPPAANCVIACSTDPECPSGQYCKDGACGADCTPAGGECGEDSCGADGRCVVPAMSGAPTAISPMNPEGLIDDMGVIEGPIDAGACIDVATGFNKVTPTVLLLIDRSLSMDESLPTYDDDGNLAPGGGFGGPSRWDTVRDILTSPDTGLIQRLQADVRFGLTLYTAEADDGGGGMQPPVNPFGQAGAFGEPPVQPFEFPGSGGSSGIIAVGGAPSQPSAGSGGEPAVPSDSGPACPLLVNVPISLNNYDSIFEAYSQAEPEYTTPTAAAVLAATQTLVAFQEEGPKIIILATDGEPGDCIYPFSQANVGSEENRAASVSAVTDALTAGVETYVISVGDVGRDHLDELASVGSPDPDAAPYLPDSAAALEQAFVDIIGDAQGCTFMLEGEKVPASWAAQGQVTLNGEPLVFGDPNGWSMPDEGTVEVSGTACEQIQNGSGEVSISFPCVPANEFSR